MLLPAGVEVEDGRFAHLLPPEVVPAARQTIGLFAAPCADELPVLREALFDLFSAHHRVGLPVELAVEAPEQEVGARGRGVGCARDVGVPALLRDGVEAAEVEDKAVAVADFELVEL